MLLVSQCVGVIMADVTSQSSLSLAYATPERVATPRSWHAHFAGSRLVKLVEAICPQQFCQRDCVLNRKVDTLARRTHECSQIFPALALNTKRGLRGNMPCAASPISTAGPRRQVHRGRTSNNPQRRVCGTAGIISTTAGCQPSKAARATSCVIGATQVSCGQEDGPSTTARKFTSAPEDSSAKCSRCALGPIQN